MGWGKYFYSVYMITLLFFVSNGIFPIVDSFAYVALYAIDNHIAYGERKTYPGIAGRSTPEYDNIITKGNYAYYRKKLKELFAEDAELRKVDQALWVYGKLFKIKVFQSSTRCSAFLCCFVSAVDRAFDIHFDAIGGIGCSIMLLSRFYPT